MTRLRKPWVMAALLMAVAVLIFFWDVLFGGKVLLPLDNLWQSLPWSAFPDQLGAVAPHNHLIGDAVLENLVWKSLARDAVLQGSLPLWNPSVFTGMPFMATGQPGALYPFGVLFYILPLLQAYGWFTALHVFLAGMFTYAFMRTLGCNWFSSVLSGLVFAFAGFVVVSFIWPMVVSCIVWLPLILLAAEKIIRQFEGQGDGQSTGRRSARLALWVGLGGLAVGLQFLAGHMEFSFYSIFIAFFYCLLRLIQVAWKTRRFGGVAIAGVSLCVMVGLGVGLAAVQLIPFIQIMPLNFRGALVTYQDVVGWALPKQRLLSFLIPDIFGNPSQHSFFDFSSWQFVSAAHQVGGQVVSFVADWDPKNYVEGCSYLGILPLLMALVAVFFRRDRYSFIFAALAIWSLLLAFGSPLYGIFFSGVPGFDQLHSPFRWIFPYSFATVALAGLGADWLSCRAGECGRWLKRGSRGLVVLGVLGMLALGIALIVRQPLIQRADGLVRDSQRLQGSFADGSAFFSFELGNAIGFGLLFLVSAIVIWLACCRSGWRPRGVPVWQGLALILVVADLFFFGYDFNARSDPALLRFQPPALQKLTEDKDTYRIISYGYDSVFEPNLPWLWDIQDARGYDSVIPRQYVEFWRLMEDPHGLLYNRIYKLVEPKSLSSPLLGLLNAKYVVTANNIGLPGYVEVYRGEINIYRNDNALPRALVVHQPVWASSKEEALASLGKEGFDPRREIVLEGTPSGERGEPSSPDAVEIISYEAGQVKLRTSIGSGGYLLLLDAFAPGWEATVNGKESEVLKADYNFRAVRLEAGENEVVFTYDPFSVKSGGFVSILSLAAVLLLLGYSGLRGRRQGPRPTGTLGTIAKNSVTPMAASLFNKVVDIGFAMLMLRILGPENVGKYSFAVIVIGYFEILTNFGLNTLLTREVAKDKSKGNRFLWNTGLLRLLLVVGVTPIIAIVLVLYNAFSGLGADTGWAIVLLAIGLVPSNIAAALSSLFYAWEKMEYPAVVSVVSTFLKVALGVVMLLGGYGFVGLAGVSIVVNVITVLIFVYLVVTKLFRPHLEVDWREGRQMLGTSFPLMLNHFLATFFFRFDVLLLKPIRGDMAVGYYSTAYKFIDGLNIIPSTFTFAIFPALSRYAASASDALLRAYTLSLRGLTMISLPLTVGTVMLAEPIILLFGGEAYVPDSVIALQLLILFLPFSYINSVTQYVLIAVDQQRFITLGFVLAVVFNVAGNAVLIPLMGYAGAAIVTVLSEIVLLVPFMRCVRANVGSVPWGQVVLRPLVASGVMGLMMWALRAWNPLVLIVLAVVVYAVALFALGTFTAEDREIWRRLRHKEA